MITVPAEWLQAASGTHAPEWRASILAADGTEAVPDLPVADRHPNTVRSWVRSGLLPAHRVGPRDIRIRRADLDAVLNRPVEP